MAGRAPGALPRCAARARRRCPSGHACAGNHMPAGSVWQIGPRRARVQGPGRRAGYQPGASSAARAVRYRCSLYLLTVIHSLGSAGMPRTCAAACMCLPTHTVRMLVHAISTSIACRHASECPCSRGCHTWPPAHRVKTFALSTPQIASPRFGYEVDPTTSDLRVGHAASPLWSAASASRVRNRLGQW